MDTDALFFLLKVYIRMDEACDNRDSVIGRKRVKVNLTKETMKGYSSDAAVSSLLPFLYAKSTV